MNIWLESIPEKKNPKEGVCLEVWRMASKQYGFSEVCEKRESSRTGQRGNRGPIHFILTTFTLK